MTAPDELCWTDAAGLARLVRSGQVSALELIDAVLARIERLRGVLRSAQFSIAWSSNTSPRSSLTWRETIKQGGCPRS